METLEHLFRDCLLAKEIFSEPPLAFQPSGSTWKEWFLLQAQVLSSELFDKFLIILWTLWSNRNNMFWRNKSQPARSLLASSLGWYEEYLQANVNQGIPKLATVKPPRYWTPPMAAKMKLNVDGAFLSNISFGGIVRDYQGQFQASFAAIFCISCGTSSYPERFTVGTGLTGAISYY